MYQAKLKKKNKVIWPGAIKTSYQTYLHIFVLYFSQKNKTSFKWSLILFQDYVQGFSSLQNSSVKG